MLTIYSFLRLSALLRTVPLMKCACTSQTAIDAYCITYVDHTKPCASYSKTWLGADLCTLVIPAALIFCCVVSGYSASRTGMMHV